MCNIKIKFEIFRLKRLHKNILNEYYLIQDIPEEKLWARALLSSATHIKSKFTKLENS